MDALKRLTPNLTVDSSAVSHSIASREGRGQHVNVGEVAGNGRYPRIVPSCRQSIRSAREKHNFMSFLKHSLGEMASHKTRSARDCDPHDEASFFPRPLRRCRTWVGQTALRKSPTALAISSGSNR
jgi:hypothetical protein